MTVTKFLMKEGLNLTLVNDTIAVTPQSQLTDSLRNFIRENKAKIVSELQEMKQQFEFEVSERVAIMIFDGKLSENEAIELSGKNTFQMWLSCQTIEKED